jgi:cellulose synthase/poly-beta-1,6-N-acetylglucosamine synthase-like glycosyltransferase
MGISELRQLATQDAEQADAPESIGAQLVRQGAVSRTDIVLAGMVQAHCDASLDDILKAEGLIDEEALLAAHAARLKTRTVDAEAVAALVSRPGDDPPAVMLRQAVLPVSDRDGMPAIVTHAPGPAQQADGSRILIAPRALIQDEIAARHRTTLAHAAQSRVSAEESCRTWGSGSRRRIALTVVLVAALATLTVIYPSVMFAIVALWAAATLAVSILLKLSAFVASLASRRPVLRPDRSREGAAPLPKVSIIVPLFRETEIAHHLIARLQRLTYPKCLLDVVLVLEEEDALTRRTLAQIDLPPWMRAVVVPDGQPRTKPRAMNYALDFCAGDIIGIFDAEDAPDPDQITVIARRFQAVPQDVVCLQGVLDYYNPRQNWLARCFTIEYATWFRLMLPGMAKLGFAIPLGGTTLYFRRDALERLGGWDAHNVTEDADLGFRLARHGMKTEMVATVTAEEANCEAWPWIKQRSRWLKGYMTTYLVHMRRPVLLYRQLGAWKFLGFHAHFVVALSQFLLAPVLWSFWLVLLGLPHPLDPIVGRSVLHMVGTLFLTAEILAIVIHASSVNRDGHRHLLPWVPTMHFYAPLGTVAVYKALYELVVKPFFWDKTTHGLSLSVAPVRASSDAMSDDGADFP